MFDYPRKQSAGQPSIFRGQKFVRGRSKREHPAGKWTVSIPSYKLNFRSHELLLLRPIPFPPGPGRITLHSTGGFVGFDSRYGDQVPRIDRCNECKTAARPPRGIRSLKTTSLIYNSCLSVNPLTFFTRYYVYTNFILQPLVVLSNIYALRLKRILKLISSFRELNASPRLQEFLPPLFPILLFFLTR